MSSTNPARTDVSACQCSQQSQDVAPPATDSTARELSTGIALTIDVSHLPPPLPMVRVLETLRDLGPNETLLVHHTRRPIHLYPKLEGLGCTHETTELPDGKIEVRITNPPARLS